MRPWKISVHPCVLYSLKTFDPLRSFGWLAAIYSGLSFRFAQRSARRGTFCQSKLARFATRAALVVKALSVTQWFYRTTFDKTTLHPMATYPKDRSALTDKQRSRLVLALAKKERDRREAIQNPTISKGT